MVEIADLRDCAPSGLFYGGRAGQKEGILIEGEPWIAKYPRTTRDLMGKHLPSYTSSPVPEYLGSHIYELLGIPVHETMLGYRAGKIVCACRDFTFPNARLFEFREIKNALSDDDAGFSSAPSDGEVILLGDVLAAIETSDLLRRVPGVRERFWDMFVADAFIKNPDRNNGNWGVLMTAPMTYELAPSTTWAVLSSASAVRVWRRIAWATKRPSARTPSERTSRAIGCRMAKAAASRSTPSSTWRRRRTPI